MAEIAGSWVRILGGGVSHLVPDATPGRAVCGVTASHWVPPFAAPRCRPCVDPSSRSPVTRTTETHPDLPGLVEQVDEDRRETLAALALAGVKGAKLRIERDSTAAWVFSNRLATVVSGGKRIKITQRGLSVLRLSKGK